MLVRSTEMVFRNGRRYRVGLATGLTEPFEFTPAKGKDLPSHFVPADTAKVVKNAAVPGGQAPGADAPLTRKQIMAELAAAGVSFKATDKTENLLAMLNKAKGELAPAASSAPSKENATGDDDAPGDGGEQTASNEDVL